MGPEELEGSEQHFKADPSAAREGGAECGLPGRQATTKDLLHLYYDHRVSKILGIPNNVPILCEVCQNSGCG